MPMTRFRGFKLFHHNPEATESMIRQIDEFPSFFRPTESRPLIIDCGANIGVSVLEWKTRWPQAQIVCFEPDPFAFELLQKNVDANDVPNVECIAAAVSDHDGTTTLYGDVSRKGDARGNSIDPAWGRRSESTEVLVACTRLSGYLAGRNVSFLKLDIEGAEERVLREIAAHLERVQAIYLEVHETDESLSYNSVERIVDLLAAAGFQIDSETRYQQHALPAHLQAWQHRVGARQFQLMCWR
ncbi:MAG: FkbM family methyltransferase [Pirellulales bacterium]|nr:FkbM family methyltransferase [Pirellulales bacterium]